MCYYTTKRWLLHYFFPSLQRFFYIICNCFACSDPSHHVTTISCCSAFSLINLLLPITDQSLLSFDKRRAAYHAFSHDEPRSMLSFFRIFPFFVHQSVFPASSANTEYQNQSWFSLSENRPYVANIDSSCDGCSINSSAPLARSSSFGLNPHSTPTGRIPARTAQRMSVPVSPR